jgi:hypothetical protein
MTVDEKVGQMTQMTVTNFEEKVNQAFLTWLKTLFKLSYRLDVKCSQSGAPTIQRWKEVITTINNEANRTRLKFLFYTVSMRSMALAIPQVQHYSLSKWNGSYF